MPKLKTHKGAKARFHITGTGRLMRRKRMSSHLRRKKPKKVRRQFMGKIELHSSDRARIQKLVPMVRKVHFFLESYIGKG